MMVRDYAYEQVVCNITENIPFEVVYTQCHGGDSTLLWEFRRDNFLTSFIGLYYYVTICAICGKYDVNQYNCSNN